MSLEYRGMQDFYQKCDVVGQIYKRVLSALLVFSVPPCHGYRYSLRSAFVQYAKNTSEEIILGKIQSIVIIF